MTDHFCDDVSTTSEYFSSDDTMSLDEYFEGNKKNLIDCEPSPPNMDNIKQAKDELKKFSVAFELEEEATQKFKKCHKCNQSFVYPKDYLDHCKSTYFRCCDNINIDTEKISRDEARKYCKYLKNQTATCLNDINQAYKQNFKKANTDAKLIQKLQQRDWTISNLRAQVEEEKNLRKSLMNTFNKSTSEQIKQLGQHLEREINQTTQYTEMLKLYNDKLEEAQQTIEQQKQLLSFYACEKASLMEGFNKIIDYNVVCSKDIKTIYDQKAEKNKAKREKTAQKKSEAPVDVPEKKSETPPVSTEEVKPKKNLTIKRKRTKIIKDKDKKEEPKKEEPVSLNDALGLTELNKKRTEAYKKRMKKLKEERDMKKMQAKKEEPKSEPDTICEKKSETPPKTPNQDFSVTVIDYEGNPYDDEETSTHDIQSKERVICTIIDNEKIVKIDDEEIGTWWIDDTEPSNHMFIKGQLNIRFDKHNYDTHNFKAYNYWSDNPDKEFIYKDYEFYPQITDKKTGKIVESEEPYNPIYHIQKYDW